jgi:hypothetical protein
MTPALLLPVVKCATVGAQPTGIHLSWRDLRLSSLSTQVDRRVHRARYQTIV